MKTLIAVPCFDMMHTDFVRKFLEMEKPDDTAFSLIQGTLIYEARNLIANNAIKCGFDRVMWIDSDMSIPKDAMIRLAEHMDAGKEFVSGLYFRRKTPINPVVCDNVYWRVLDDGNVETFATSYVNYPENQVFEIAGAGFGCCMTSVELLKDVVGAYGSPFTPMMGIGEDLAFCWRVNKLGHKMYCDSRIKCGHIGQYVYEEKDRGKT